MAGATARAIVEEATFWPGPRDKAHHAAFAKAALSPGALDRMLDVARHRLMKEDRHFGADPKLLNVANGTLDLRTGALRPHELTNLLTFVRVGELFDHDQR